MRPYLANATDRHGRRDSIAREAASLEHARMVLEREGYRDIEFVDDETTARMRSAWEPALQPKSAGDFRFLARLAREGSSGALIWRETLRRNVWLLLPLAGAIVYGAARGFTFWFWAGAIGLALFAFGVARGSRAASLHAKLSASMARGSLDQAEHWLRRLEAEPVATRDPQVRNELVFQRGMLLAMRGRLDEGLALVEPLRAEAGFADGMFENRVAGLYYVAGRIPDVLAMQERAVAASSGATMQVLDHAFSVARFGDVARARALIEPLDVRVMNPAYAAVRLGALGVCALREGDNAAASSMLGEAVREMGKLAGSSAAWPLLGILCGYAALASARDGQPAQAQAILAPWRQVALHCVDASTRSRIEAEVPA